MGVEAVCMVSDQTTLCRVVSCSSSMFCGSEVLYGA